MQPEKKRLPKLAKQSLPDLHVIYKYIILKLHVNKLYINTFAKIIIIENVLGETCFSGAHLCKKFIIRFF